MQARELKRLGATRIFAVRRRDGRWFQERTPVVGFHWQTSGIAWCRSQRLSSKWPRSLAEGVARQVGGEVIEVVQGQGRVPFRASSSRRWLKVKVPGGTVGRRISVTAQPPPLPERPPSGGLGGGGPV